jgi:transcriptional regulator with XRE-family HTH domain
VTLLGERIKELRKSLNLTQKEFGERIGVKPNTIATYEIGRNQPIDAVISLMCREFKVSYDWLTTGQGEMFEDLPETVMDELTVAYHLDEMDRKIISKYLALNGQERAVIKKYIESILGK